MTTPIPPNKGNPNRFVIPVGSHQVQRFRHQAPISIELSTDAARQYEVHRKDIPDKLYGEKYQGKEVTWLNNFGLKPNRDPEFSVEVPPYRIHIQKVPSAKTYVYYDGSEIKPLDSHANPNDENDIVAELPLGDPSIGWA